MTDQPAVTIKTVTGAPDIAVVSINRPARKNALNDAVIDGLLEAAARFRDDATTRAVILRGEGGFFSAGADLSVFDAIGDERDVNKIRRLAHKGTRLCAEWEALPQPTIAAIEGGAVGGGLGLTLACDWRVMAQDAWIYVPEVKLGLNYGWNTLPRLTRLVGPARAKTISILCRRHPAAECLDWGAADVIAREETADEAALALAAEVAALPRLAAQMIKRSINATANALSAATSYADMDDMLVCLTDPEGEAMRMKAMSPAPKKD